MALEAALFTADVHRVGRLGVISQRMVVRREVVRVRRGRVNLAADDSGRRGPPTGGEPS